MAIRYLLISITISIAILIAEPVGAAEFEIESLKRNGERMVETAGPARVQTVVTLLPACIQAPLRRQGAELAIGQLVSSAIIPKLVDKGFNALSGAIREAGAAENKTTTVKTNSYFYELDKASNSIKFNKSFGCLIIAKGLVNPETKKFTSAECASKLSPNNLTANARNLSEATGIGIDPEFYFEAAIIPADDATAFKLQSRYLSYSPYKIPSKSNRRPDFVITVELTDPSADKGKDIFALATLKFENLEIGTLLNSEQLRSVESIWFPIPSKSASAINIVNGLVSLKNDISTASRAVSIMENYTEETYNDSTFKNEEIRRLDLALNSNLITYEDRLDAVNDSTNPGKNSKQRLQTRYEHFKERHQLIAERDKPITIDYVKALNTAQATLATLNTKLGSIKNEASFTPINVSVVITETGDANEFLLAVADIFDKSKADLANLVVQNLSPTAKDTADENAQIEAFADSKVVLEKDQLVVLTEFQLSQLDASSQPEKHLSKKHELNLAKLEANEARRKAGLPAIYDIEF